MSPTSSSTPVVKSRLSKTRRKSGLKPSPASTGLIAGTSSSSSVIVKKDNDSTTMSPMCPPLSIPSRCDKVSTSNPSYYRNYEMLTSSPFHIPNSQAPIPGKEVYWDYDTPQSRKCREAFAREFEESDSPVAKKNEATPKLRMVAKTRIESTTSIEQARKGEEAMQELLDLCREAEVKDERKSSETDGEKVCQLKFENLSMELELKEEVKEDMDEDMFGDDDLGDTFDFDTGEVVEMKKEIVEMKKEGKDHTEIFDDAINSDMFDDDDESFLLQATQAAEVEMVVKKKAVPVVVARTVKEAEVTKPQPVKVEPVIAKCKVEPMVPHPALARVQAESDGFGSEDDSFDELLSQMDDPIEVEEAPASPVLKRKRKCFDLAPPSNPKLPLSELNRQLPVTSAQSRHQPVTTFHSRQLPVTAVQSRQQPVMAAQSRQQPLTTPQSRQQPVIAAQSRATVGTLKKYGSFDSQEQKKTFPRIKSEPNIGSVQTNMSSTIVNRVMGNMVNSVVQPVNRPVTRSSCTKEDIDRKRREALARRQMSQLSQAKR